MTSAAARATATDRLSFLLARHGRLMKLRLREALAVSGLGPRHGALLLRLADTGTVSQQALIEALTVDPSTLVAILNDLERDALAERRRDPADRRRHLVAITPAGLAAAATVEAAVGAVEREAFADLDADEVAQLHALLRRVDTSFDSHSSSCE
ncbi:MarR family winged helix-turn-helix transcriptional regulator [Kitasatospora sp. NBC_01287]|uniref:MarR family winged helix-turn-helix transcriptional regulator n=1 Tax=Kitasatospora sp. NBC_01287 TaxID=2903573 RepID=UPI0022561948|nr:MarR family winged helix-turn-helix transcriptional regulator [Kitasatospora sp. NBC_01287]MCX4749759.1 MarR family winged helix-turn-helix transcriptional regulator [Kitasatospora sp. NBC_01287]